MGLVNLPIILGLFSAFSGAITNILAKTVMGFSKPRDYISINFGVIFLLLLPFAPKYFFLDPSILSIGLIICASVIDGWANYFYFKSFASNDPGTVSGLLSLSPFFALLALPIFARISTIQIHQLDIVGMLLIILGVVALNIAINQENSTDLKFRHKFRLLIIPLMSSILFGLNIYIIKYIFTENMTNPYTYYTVRAVVIVIIMFVFFPPDLRWVNGRNIGVTSFRAIFVIIKWMCLLYALDLGNPAIVKSVSEVTPLFVLILAAIFLKEVITRMKVIGSVLIVFGLLLISI